MGSEMCIRDRSMHSVVDILLSEIANFVTYPTDTSVIRRIRSYNKTSTIHLHVDSLESSICIDCTHIRIMPSSDEEHAYIKTKGRVTIR